MIARFVLLSSLVFGIITLEAMDAAIVKAIKSPINLLEEASTYLENNKHQCAAAKICLFRILLYQAAECSVDTQHARFLVDRIEREKITPIVTQLNGKVSQDLWSNLFAQQAAFLADIKATPSSAWLVSCAYSSGMNVYSNNKPLMVEDQWAASQSGNSPV